MRAVLGFLGALILGAIGWRVGMFVGLWAALLLSAIGSGVGLYWARRLFDEWLG